MSNPLKTEGAMRMCLGCAHLKFEEGRDYSYSEYTSGHDDSYFQCGKKHWNQEMGSYVDDGTYASLEEKMLLANTCPDFTERKP